VVGVGADEHRAPGVVGDDLVEVAAGRAADRAGIVEPLRLEGEVLEAEALDARERGHGVDALLAAGTEQLQRRVHVHLGVVEARDR
jgi:hypothetical protein